MSQGDDLAVDNLEVDGPLKTGSMVLDEILGAKDPDPKATADRERAAALFDARRLATPQDWADLEDFDEDAVIASMTRRVEETWLETQREVQAEKQSGVPAASSAALQDSADASIIAKGSTVKILGLSSRAELNGQIATAERFNRSKGRYAVRLADGSSILLKPHNLDVQDPAAAAALAETTPDVSAEAAG